MCRKKKRGALPASSEIIKNHLPTYLFHEICRVKFMGQTPWVEEEEEKEDALSEDGGRD